MIKKDWGEDEQRKLHIGLLLLLLAVFLGIHFLDPSFYPTIYHLSKDGDLHGTIRYLKGFGIYAAMVSFFIDVVVNIVGFLPSIFISTANGLIFGLFWGTVVSWLAETTGVIMSFYIMRTLFRGMAKDIIAKSRTLTKLDEYDSWQAVAFARAIPYMPNGLVTAIAALSSMPFRYHLIGSLIGKLPSVALEVVLGHDIINMGTHAIRLTVIVVTVAIVYGLIWWYMKKRNRKG